MKRIYPAVAILLALCCLVAPGSGAPLSHASESGQAISAPCGIVDDFGFPVPDVDVSRTDFGIYRTRWGGLHVGIDVAFRRHGDPVVAAARGRVTYSDTEGWDTEKGVVVLTHTFPDGTLINTLYGHMEEMNGYTFPPMDSCVEKGDIVGAVGDPDNSAPHLHFEVRTRYRHEGGPGYTDRNPLELGWLHPVDFIYRARVMVDPAYRGSISFTDRLSAPPVLLPSGQYVLPHSRYLEGVGPGGVSLWRFDTVGSVTDLIGLPDNRALAITSENQVLIVSNGSVNGLWLLGGNAAPGAMLDTDRLIVVLNRDTVAAYSLEGMPLWSVGPLPSRITQWAHSGDRYAFVGMDGSLRVLDRDGQMLLETRLSPAPQVFAGSPGSFVVLQGETLQTLDATLALQTVVQMPRSATSGAQVVTAGDGRMYLYPGEGRSLYAYNPAGELQWIGYLPGESVRSPQLAVGGGKLVSVLTADGTLLNFDTFDGRLLGQHELYTGGLDGGGATARWVYVDANETIHFSAGFLTVAALDGHMLLAR